MANNAETGRRALLLTRPPAGAARFLAALDPDVLGEVTICLSPLIDIVEVPHSDETGDHAGIIFTSTNGVAQAVRGNGRPAYCVGDRTRQEAEARGWKVVVATEDADALVARLSALRPPGPLLHLAGAHRRGRIAERLTAAGIETRVTTVYDQRLQPLTAEAQDLLAAPIPVILPLFSPRTAAHFLHEAVALRNVHALAISPAVAEAVAGAAFASLQVAKAPTGEEMARGVEKLLRKDSLC